MKELMLVAVIYNVFIGETFIKTSYSKFMRSFIKLGP